MKRKLLHKVKLNYFVKMLQIIMVHLDPSWELNCTLLAVPLFALFGLVFGSFYLCLVVRNCATKEKLGFNIEQLCLYRSVLQKQ